MKNTSFNNDVNRSFEFVRTRRRERKTSEAAERRQSALDLQAGVKPVVRNPSDEVLYENKGTSRANNKIK